MRIGKRLRIILPLAIVGVGLAIPTNITQKPNIDKAKEMLAQMLKSQLVPALESLKSQYSNDPEIEKGLEKIIEKLNKMEPLDYNDFEVFKLIAEKEVEKIPDNEITKNAQQLLTQLEGMKSYVKQMLTMYGGTNNPMVQKIMDSIDKTINNLKEKIETNSVTKEDLIEANYSLLTMMFGFLNSILLSLSGHPNVITSQNETIIGTNQSLNISKSPYIEKDLNNKTINASIKEKVIRNNTNIKVERPITIYNSSQIEEPANATKQSNGQRLELNETIKTSNNIQTIQTNIEQQNNISRENIKKEETKKYKVNLSIPNLNEIKEKLGNLKVKLYLLVNKAIEEKRQYGKISEQTKEEIIGLIKQFLILKLEEYEAILFQGVSDSDDKEILLALDVLSNNGNSIFDEIEKVKEEIENANTIADLKKAFFDYVKLKEKIRQYINSK